MKITYIHHSSFSIEFSNAVFLFDYYAGELPEYPREKDIFVLASHKHDDHFRVSVLSLSEIYPNIHFLLSKDIRMNRAYLERKKVPASAYDKISYIGKNSSAEFMVGGSVLQVETLASTDEGVAFLLAYEGKSLYHAGDLNWWTWIGETEAEYEDMTRRFQTEIQKMEGRHFDAAFVPLDPRQEERYWWGFDYFMRKTDTDVVFPMHFQMDYMVMDRLLKETASEPYRHKIKRIRKEGETFSC
ncbi:MBL fold metallo-hydrolase [Lacrimispora sp. NSJ-141]|uniref:MBL fold metallo-hydrolase n=1 Tax=Lientehia hominis TaxID=2897778 RepID=A0AAP2RFB0_9FIRM|nr:MBL fold metallo-hydrolase [Lientehia hominis]MCD2491144.1 MBL fold metallo-hydrolase [Lientehia hominis]